MRIMSGFVFLLFAIFALGPPVVAQTAAGQSPAGPPQIVRHGEGRAVGVLGRSVFDASGDDIGRVVDVLVDGEGRPLAAVVDVGGFLGIGTRRVAVAWETLRFQRIDGVARISEDLTMDEVAAAPEYRGGDGVVEAIGRRRAPAN
jgi:hypothetical protein